MKQTRIIAAAMVTVIAVACTVAGPESVDTPSLSGQELTLTATLGEPETRTERASDGSVLWSPGDEISLFYGSGSTGGSRFTA
ncbi:MAG: hypothetical protein IKH11_08000, partial [Bacteroidales bacterium]|nr:hypothetical protein [Bacteroidales bacterium]